jgi:FG-GAP-like repeat
VTPGQVAFCDMSTYCTGAHLYGIAQLTSAGTAVFRHQPFLGALRYKAIFLGTHTYAGSSSAESDLTVNESMVPTGTAASVNQTQFSATVSAFSSAAPTGSVTFTDQNSTSLGDSNLVSNPPTFAMNAFVIDNGLTTTQVAMLAGDFNGDGVLDFMEQLSPSAAPELPAGSIDVRLGNGDGTFGSAIPCGVSGVPPSAFATGDFNGDGILDVVSYSTYSGSPNLLQVLLGNGDDTFTPLPAVTIPQFASGNVSLIVGDWNRDGNLDIALTTYNSTSISLLWGNGDGTFSSSISSLSVNTFFSGFVTGDFNNDGNPDIALGERNGSSGQLSIFYGDGAGNFTKTSVVSAPSSSGLPFSLLTSDINNDGYADLLFVGSSGNTTLGYVLLGNSTESPTQVVYIPTFASGASGVPIALADFNGDGVIDVASTSGGKSPVVLQLGYGDGTFSSGPQATVPGILLSTPLLSDWAGNGIPNLLVSSDVNDKEADYYGYQNYILPPATQSATATLSIPSISVLPPGSYEITASYAGDSAYEPSTASFSYTRNVISTTLSLKASVNPGTYGGPGTLSATLSPFSQGSLTTNGDSVSFLANNVLLGTGTLTSSVATLPMAGIRLEHGP